MSLKKAVGLIRKNKRFLVTTHVNAEGDALGSSLAFCRLLRFLGKEARLVIADGLSDGYDFLPGISRAIKFSPKLKPFHFDCFVALDCSDLRRTGSVGKFTNSKKPMLNIDHHISNDRFADVNWVEPGASSTSEMVYKIYKAMRLPVDRDAALLLYVGIMTDTGSFRYPNTTGFTHLAISELIKRGLNVTDIYKKIYENIPLAEARLLAKILPGMKEGFGGKVIWFELKRSLLGSKKTSFDLSEEILGFARAIKGVELALLFKENLNAPDEIRVNFRSQGKIDVNRIARHFGGGGHKTASGANIKGSIESVRRKVLAKLKSSFR